MGNTWKPISKEELDKIIESDLKKCNSQQLAFWEKYSVNLRKAPIDRFNEIESVFVVAMKDNEAMYYEDIEEGFNISPLDNNGKILERGCNQNDLSVALNYWIS